MKNNWGQTKEQASRSAKIRISACLFCKITKDNLYLYTLFFISIQSFVFIVLAGNMT
jgi:hypothetical protein